MVDKVMPFPASVEGVGKDLAHNKPQPASANQPKFEEILGAKLGRPLGVRFSAHAQRRLENRGISFSSKEAVRLEQAVEKAASKGGRESLILLDDLALVVSVKNRIVITAVDADSRKENVFTNIDSVVLT